MIVSQSLLSFECVEAAKEHARRSYPEESCGLVVAGAYLPAENMAVSIEAHESDNKNCGCRICSFQIDPKFYLAAKKRGDIEAVLHSHPGGPLCPSQADMEGQIASGVAWGIIPLDMEGGSFRIGDPIMWGGTTPVALILGREFMHGIHDCYSLIRDTFALGKEELRTQGLTRVWPFDPIMLPEVPRSDEWWKGGQDLYHDGMKVNGFRTIDQSEARPGDGFLMKVRADVFNHAGLLVDQDLILHHLPGRLSRREPAGIWGRAAELWVRYEGPGA